MRIVLSFENFTGFGGSESYTVAVARECERLGHDVTIYSPNRGELAEIVGREGIPVLGIAALPDGCELVVAGDAATAHDLARRYGDAVKLMVVHSADHMLQAPPQLADRCDGLIVLNDRVGRAVQARGWHAPVRRLRQPIELTRFCDLGPCRATAQVVLVSTNYVEAARSKIIEAACRAQGLTVRWIGATTRPSAAPEYEIAAADIVIGLGRTALETMATGRAAYVYGVVGGDGWVTPERYAAMEADGFAGTAFGDVHIDAERMACDFALWTEVMGEAGRDLASAHHSAREHAVALLAFARELGAPGGEPVTLAGELAHLVRLQWREQQRAVAGERELTRLRAELTEVRAEMADVQRRIEASEARYAALRGTRRYRLATRIAKPLDRWRNGRAR